MLCGPQLPDLAYVALASTLSACQCAASLETITKA